MQAHPCLEMRCFDIPGFDSMTLTMATQYSSLKNMFTRSMAAPLQHVNCISSAFRHGEECMSCESWQSFCCRFGVIFVLLIIALRDYRHPIMVVSRRSLNAIWFCAFAGTSGILDATLEVLTLSVNGKSVRISVAQRPDFTAASRRITLTTTLDPPLTSDIFRSGTRIELQSATGSRILQVCL